TLYLSLLPPLLDTLWHEPNSCLRVASLVGAVYVARRARETWRQAGELLKLELSLRLSMLVGATVSSLLLVNALVLGAFAPYAFALFLSLLLAGGLFYSFVLDAWDGGAATPERPSHADGRRHAPAGGHRAGLRLDCQAGPDRSAHARTSKHSAGQ